MGVLATLTGVLVHDGYASYRMYTAVTHALCNAHSAEPGIMRNGRGGGDRMAWCSWVRWVVGRDLFRIIAPV